MKKAVPFLEVFNREQIQEAGFKYKEEILRLKQEILHSKNQIGTLQGDRNIEEAELDPNMFLNDLDDEEGVKDSEDGGKSE